MHILDARQILRLQSQERIHAPATEEQTAEAAEKGKQHTLHQHLPDQPPAPGPERSSHRQFLRAPSHPREQKVCEIRAGNQQNQSHRPEKNQKRRANVSDHSLVQRNQNSLAILVLFRIRLSHAVIDDAKLALRCAQGNARPQSSVGAEDMRPTRLRGERIKNVHRNECFIRRPRWLEIGSQHADHPVTLGGQIDLLAHDSGVPAKLALPQSVAENHDPRATEAIVLRRDRSPERRPRAENPEEIARDQPKLDLNRLAAAGVIGRQHSGTAQTLERLALRLNVLQLGGGLIRFERDDLFRLGIRQRPQQDAVDDAKDGGVRADAEGQGDDSDGEADLPAGKDRGRDLCAAAAPRRAYLRRQQAHDITLRLFITKRDHRIDFHGAARREVTGEQGGRG